MFRMIYKDLRISPIRTFLTGFSMFIGVISMVLAVLVGTLGKESLMSINAQISGYKKTYSIQISEADFSDTENMDKLLESLQKTKSKTLVISPSKSLSFAGMDNLDQLKDYKKLYRKFINAEVVYTTLGYNEIYNLPIFKGRWFNQLNKPNHLEVVLNKQGYDAFHSKYVVSSVKDSLNLTPFNVVGVVNDGKDWPVIYVNIKPMSLYFPNFFDKGNGVIYWHNDGSLSESNMIMHINDMLYDTIKGKVESINRADNSDSYTQVIDMLQIGLAISAALLLFVAILGQINIGLSSLEQRTHELLIRRALGASKYNIAMLVLSSLLFLSIVVCIMALIISAILVYVIGVFFLPFDSPIPSPSFPINATFIAVIVSIFTALLGGLIPAIKASRLEPALALR